MDLFMLIKFDMVILFSELKFDWEVLGYKVNEGVVVIVRYGCVFIIYLVSVMDYCYVMGLLWVDENVDLLDFISWYKCDKLIFIINVVVGCFGLGYNGFVKVEDGVIDFMIYYSCDYEILCGMFLIDFNCYVRVWVIYWDVEGFFVL